MPTVISNTNLETERLKVLDEFSEYLLNQQDDTVSKAFVKEYETIALAQNKLEESMSTTGTYAKS